MIGTDSFSAVTPFGEAVDSACVSAGRARIASVRSLFGPGLLNAWLKFPTTGVAVCSSEVKRERNSGSSFWLGLDTFTNCVSALSVGGSSANVRLPCAQGQRQLMQSPGEARLLRADRLEGRVGVPDQVRELF